MLELGKLHHDAGHADEGFASFSALLVELGVALERGRLGFVARKAGDRAGECVDAQWQIGAGLETAAAGAGGFEGVEAASDAGSLHPEGEAFEGCAAGLGDGVEGFEGIGQVLKDGGGDFGGGAKGEVIWRGILVLGGEAEGIGRVCGVG